jgi:hypothetical protein
MAIQMHDWEYPGRVDTFEYRMVDPFDLDKDLGALDGVYACRITEQYYSQDIITGTVKLRDCRNYRENSLVRAYHHAIMPDGQTATREVATCKPAIDKGSYLYGNLSASIPLRSMLTRYSDDMMVAAGGWNKGASIRSAIQDLVASRGGTLVVSDSVIDRALADSIVYATGDNILTVLNQLADALGCGGLGVDAHGRLVLSPYVEPAAKPLMWTFRPTAWGRNAIYEPGLEIEDNARTIKNRVICEYTAATGGYAVTADLDASHRCSYQQRGWYDPERYTYSECPSKDWLQEKATVLLKDLMGGIRRFGIRASYVPLETGDVGRLTYQDQPGVVAFDEVVLMQTKQYDLSPGIPAKYTLKSARALTSTDIILSGTGV